MPSTFVQDDAPLTDDLLAEVLEGLSRPHKALPSKLFYDEQGSVLFDRITELEEYYPTRIEVAIMERYLDEMVTAIGERALLVEFGSGSSDKTSILLDRARKLAAYVPVDISCDYLESAAERLRQDHPALSIHPLCADYTRALQLPPIPVEVSHTVVYFPGSTIGNFQPEDARTFLGRIRTLTREKGGLLIGVDLKKAPEVLHAAYNDREGATAAFNLNLLARLNREMGATFDVSRFYHHAAYNPREGRIEMYLVSIVDQVVQVAGSSIPFREGEAICTEYSYKYTIPAFAGLARSAGFDLRQAWTDARRYFAVLYLEAC